MSFEVESDAQLAAEVDPRARALPLNGVARGGSQAVPYRLPPNPWEFLLAAGRATAAIFSPVRQLFDASSHWAIVRWFWALDWSSPEVRLSAESKQIRNHHRTAFSEALGLAAALMVTEHLAGDALPPGAWRGGPMLVDVDSLVSSGVRPDLLILFGGPTLTTYVIEAKGNRRGRGRSIEQLRRGVDQVLAAPGPARRLVVGAAAPDPAPGPGFSVHAISVPGPEASAPGRLLGEAEERGLELERARLASFAGLSGTDWDGPVFEMPALGLEVVGQRLTLRGERLNAELTMGVDREIVRRLGEVRSLTELAAMRSETNRGSDQRTPPDAEGYSLAEAGRAAAVAHDGCALSVSLR
jgi:hypothetical protein